MALFKGSGIDNVVAALALRRLGRRAEAEKVIASIRATPNITRLSLQSWALEILAGQSGRELALPDSPGLSRTLPESPRVSQSLPESPRVSQSLLDTGYRVIREWRGLQQDKRMRGKKFGVFSQ